MLLRSGDRWHCTYPSCRSELCVGTGWQLEVDSLYCPCGGVMKKNYTSPVFRYLDFLGDRAKETMHLEIPDRSVPSGTKK